ncbi:hypothetical protein L3C95_09595 [Chitinophaga filiformis]|uniref:hypothetical protein n=1 Tax=Chitinophaga filiformis TaxID=104663 RepID=UPI001F468BD0|nr:hypothetical protein [Chitinophaga filiformis]MCF6403127.1 hypothetical protein [Chitinophaga filiformis]
MNGNRDSLSGLITELISILTIVKEKITDDSDLIWTSYETHIELREEIDRCIYQLQQNHERILDEIKIHFAPTSVFQEQAMSNGWTEEYRALAERFDDVYELLNRYR